MKLLEKISQENMIHLKSSEKMLVKIQKQFPELSTVDIGIIIEKAKTETKIITYMLNKTLMNENTHQKEQDSHIEIKPSFVELQKSVPANIQKSAKKALEQSDDDIHNHFDQMFSSIETAGSKRAIKSDEKSMIKSAT